MPSEGAKIAIISASIQAKERTTACQDLRIESFKESIINKVVQLSMTFTKVSKIETTPQMMSAISNKTNRKRAAKEEKKELLGFLLLKPLICSVKEIG